MRASVPSYYDILQVDRDAPASDIRAAYRRMAQRYHPDKSPDNAYAPRVMAHLNKAYEILSDPARREKHNAWIDSKQAQRAQTAHTGRSSVKATGSLSRPAPLPDLEQRVTRWPWYLLFATITFAVASIGLVAYRSLLPARSTPRAASEPVVSPHPVQAAPGRQAALPAEPVVHARASHAKRASASE